MEDKIKAQIKETLQLIEKKFDNVYFNEHIKDNMELKKCLWQLEYVTKQALEIIEEP